jgi:hypothetical protein
MDADIELIHYRIIAGKFSKLGPLKNGQFPIRVIKK